MFASVTYLAIASLTFACQAATADHEEPNPQPPHVPKLDPAFHARLHMQANFAALREVEHALVRGHLVEAKISASSIANAPVDHELDDWFRKTAYVRELARDVATATSRDEALRRLPAVAVACAECHVATGGWPKLALAPNPPPDRGGDGIVTRMARHQWAVARLWDGMIGGNEDSWRAGLEVLAATPPPYSINDGDKVALAKRLQQIATTALQHRFVDSLDDRAEQYGAMLVTCAACHATESALTNRTSPASM